LFVRQSGENRGAFAKANLKRFAAEVGMDAVKFNSCVDTDKYLDKVRAEAAAAKQKGITSTPVFLINGQQISGAQPYDQFDRIINVFLKK
jgi:predicted DsbA family dithiol-disulfide isomerase